MQLILIFENDYCGQWRDGRRRGREEEGKRKCAHRAGGVNWTDSMMGEATIEGK